MNKVEKESIVNSLKTTFKEAGGYVSHSDIVYHKLEGYAKQLGKEGYAIFAKELENQGNKAFLTARKQKNKLGEFDAGPLYWAGSSYSEAGELYKKAGLKRQSKNNFENAADTVSMIYDQKERKGEVDRDIIEKKANALKNAGRDSEASQLYRKAGDMYSGGSERVISDINETINSKGCYVAYEKSLGDIYNLKQSAKCYENAHLKKDVKRVNKIIKEVNEIKRELKPVYDVEKRMEVGAVAASVLGSVGMFYFLFSKPQGISPQALQLAPPSPNYAMYIVSALFILGIGYFAVKKIKSFFK
jgi:tetratricopeptide (TPR) repeat protein